MATAQAAGKRSLLGQAKCIVCLLLLAHQCCWAWVAVNSFITSSNSRIVLTNNENRWIRSTLFKDPTRHHDHPVPSSRSSVQHAGSKGSSSSECYYAPAAGSMIEEEITHRRSRKRGRRTMELFAGSSPKGHDLFIFEHDFPNFSRTGVVDYRTRPKAKADYSKYGGENEGEYGDDEDDDEYDDDKEKEKAMTVEELKELSQEVLQKRYGHRTWREGQEEVVNMLISGRSCASIFPTGAGKSLCYQVPAVVLYEAGEGMTLVVSPLIALMKDQVDALTRKNIPCARMDSTVDSQDMKALYQEIRRGELALLYVSPERFNNERFQELLRKVPIALFVVDEAHCISEWGHNFRPDYLRLADFAENYATAPIRLALTATATEKVAQDILDRLHIPRSNVIRTQFHRPNLYLAADTNPAIPIDVTERARLLAHKLDHPPFLPRPETSSSGRRRRKEKQQEVVAAVGPTLVYVTFQNTAEQVAAVLQKEGINARAYHAGMTAADREEVQEWFMHLQHPKEAPPVVVGTVALGMGLDKSDIRYVYHFNLPKSVEEYAQEVGRAGRDGEPAYCEALVSAADIPQLKGLIYGNTPSPKAVDGLLQELLVDERDQLPPLQMENMRETEGRRAPRGTEMEMDISLYDLSQALDVKDIVLKTVLARLQMSGLLKEVTPYFSSQKVSLSDGYDVQDIMELIHEDEEESGLKDGARAVLRVTAEYLAQNKRRKWYDLPVKEVAELTGLPKLIIPSIIQELANQDILVKGAYGKIRSRYQVRVDIGSDASSYSQLAANLYAGVVALESKELQRLDDVIKLLGKGAAAMAAMMIGREQNSMVGDDVSDNKVVVDDDDGAKVGGDGGGMMSEDNEEGISTRLSRYFGDNLAALQQARLQECSHCARFYQLNVLISRQLSLTALQAASTWQCPGVPSSSEIAESFLPMERLIYKSAGSKTGFTSASGSNSDVMVNGTPWPTATAGGVDDDDNDDDDDGGDGGVALPLDDPFLLARVACGVKSPRITKLRLTQLKEFGCCSTCPFPEVLRLVRHSLAIRIEREQQKETTKDQGLLPV